MAVAKNEKALLSISKLFLQQNLYILLPNKNSIPSIASCYTLSLVLFCQNLTTLKPYLGTQERHEGQRWGKVWGSGEPEEWDEQVCSTSSLVRRHTKKFNSLILSHIRMKNSLVKKQNKTKTALSDMLDDFKHKLAEQPSLEHG